MYVSNMEQLFQKIPVEIPGKRSPKEKCQSLLHAIVDGYYVNKLGQKLPLLKERKLGKKI